ncbi:hypothetical protein C2W64_01971 [Brevibacillus laterosporus]|nr:S8 family peptidase [Brevibacillus laterosporus]RAP26427.1 hypothetical protein C2W64_01971 [Brevibacillus laterosporus]
MNGIYLLPTFITEEEKRINEISPNGVNMVGAPSVWSKSEYGKGVVVAVLDTGCQLDHPDLQENIIGGRNFTSDYNNDPNNFSDNHYHGTHVAGIIASSFNGEGIIGVAPKASLLILKVLKGNGSGEYESVIQAIEYAIQWSGEKGEKVRIITMSLGGTRKDLHLHKAIKRAILNEILVICAAGNDGDGNINTSEERYPSFYPEVVSVGAIDNNKNLAYFSNTNEEIDFVAPGVDILSTCPGSTYQTLSGTSMAAPHIAGAAALIVNAMEKKLNRSLTEKEIYQQLCSQSIYLGHGKKAEGHGLINFSLNNSL